MSLPPPDFPAVTWEGNTPVSLRFADVYRSHGMDGQGGLHQARHVFLGGCELPQRFSQAQDFQVLELGFGLGLNFLATAQKWLEHRPWLHKAARLHYVGVEAWPVDAADIVRSAQAYGDEQIFALAESLALQWWGLSPGWHRLELLQGRVQLTLCIGHAEELLPKVSMQAHAVYLDGFTPMRNAQMWSPALMHALRKCCHSSVRVATWSVAGAVRAALQGAGFLCEKFPGLPPKRQCLQARLACHASQVPGMQGAAVYTVSSPKAVVVGAGLAGAACARSLAENGWQVEVVDAAGHVAAGASGLPVGLFAPRISADDNLMSQALRTGLRMMLAQMRTLLQEGVDYGVHQGVEEHRCQDKLLAHHDALCQRYPALREWSTVEGHLLRHHRAGWCRPSALVQAWLEHPAIALRTKCMMRSPEDILRLRQECDAVVLACGWNSAALLSVQLPLLRLIRGQMLWGRQATLMAQQTMAGPSNGHGYWVSGMAVREAGLALHWACGSTYQRDSTDAMTCEADAWENVETLRGLLPYEAGLVAYALQKGETRRWSGVRCYSNNRWPLITQALPGVYLCTGLGSRGLSLAWMAGQVLAALVQGLPMPLPLPALRLTRTAQ